MLSAVSAVTTTTTIVAPRRRCRDVHTQRTNLHYHHHYRSSLPTKTTTTTTTRAISPRQYQLSYEHSHDAKYQSWLHDLVTVVESNTWSAVPALLRFPSAEPEIVLALAAGAGQAGTPLGHHPTPNRTPSPPRALDDICSKATFKLSLIIHRLLRHRHHRSQSSREVKRRASLTVSRSV